MYVVDFIQFIVVGWNEGKKYQTMYQNRRFESPRNLQKPKKNAKLQASSAGGNYPKNSRFNWNLLFSKTDSRSAICLKFKLFRGLTIEKRRPIIRKRCSNWVNVAQIQSFFRNRTTRGRRTANKIKCADEQSHVLARASFRQFGDWHTDLLGLAYFNFGHIDPKFFIFHFLTKPKLLESIGQQLDKKARVTKFLAKLSDVQPTYRYERCDSKTFEKGKRLWENLAKNFSWDCQKITLRVHRISLVFWKNKC